MKFNVIIPMAGESSRFNYEFKPFLKLDNRAFVEHVMESFKSLDVESYNFIVTEQQDIKHSVGEKLKKQFFFDLADKINVIKITEKTAGPYQTILSGLKIIGDLQNTIICDCDHHVDVSPIDKKLLLNSTTQIIIPIWNISNEEQKNWGKIVLNNKDRSIQKICEKEILTPTPGETIYGILGCYFFKNTKDIVRNNHYLHFSDFLKEKHADLNIDIAVINKAYFFGTSEMAKRSVELRRRWGTVLCDVDGVLIKHKNHSTDKSADNLIINNCVEKIKKWKSENKKVILVTARPENTKKSFKENLQRLGIEYDDIIMGLNPGPRYLINDIKPSNPFVKQASSINLIRDVGINEIVLKEEEQYNIEIIKVFKGNSFSKVYLLKDRDKIFVRKHIIKNNKSLEHYEKMKRQLDDLQRFSFYEESLVPKILDVQDRDHDYYFDMEYLNGYKQLDQYDTNIQNSVLRDVIMKLTDNVYCYRKANKSNSFVTNFFSTKIEPKLDAFSKECPIMDYLINNETVVLNNKPYYGLREILKKINIYKFNIEYLNPIHGDLTLENILYNEEKRDFKLIDMDGSRYMDSCYFDIGKIFQSIVSKYKEWNDIEDVITNIEENKITCVDQYFHCDVEEFKEICENYMQSTGNHDWKDVFRKGIFYMSMYFIRFVPFRRQKSFSHGIFAIIMAINWLNYLYKE